MAASLTITTIFRRRIGVLVLSTGAAAGMIGLTTAGTVAAAPACTQWGFPGPYSLQQTNDATVRFNSNGSAASGFAEAATINGGLVGSVSGGIQGDKLDFTIRWNNAIPQATGHYTATVGADGIAHGQTQDLKTPSSRALWDATVPLVCITPSATPTPAPVTTVVPFPGAKALPPGVGPQSPAPAVATVSSDVDVYDDPSGGGTIVGILRAGQQVDLIGVCKKNDWCHVVGPAVPGGRGWVFGALQF